MRPRPLSSNVRRPDGEKTSHEEERRGTFPRGLSLHNAPAPSRVQAYWPFIVFRLATTLPRRRWCPETLQHRLRRKRKPFVMRIRHLTCFASRRWWVRFPWPPQKRRRDEENPHSEERSDRSRVPPAYLSQDGARIGGGLRPEYGERKPVTSSPPLCSTRLSRYHLLSRNFAAHLPLCQQGVAALYGFHTPSARTRAMRHCSPGWTLGSPRSSITFPRSGATARGARGGTSVATRTSGGTSSMASVFRRRGFNSECLGSSRGCTGTGREASVRSRRIRIGAQCGASSSTSRSATKSRILFAG